MSGKTIDQRRAKHAWDSVTEATNRLNSQDQKKFGGQAKKLPTQVVTSGLGQALAFLKAKNYAPLLLSRLGDWVLDKRQNPGSKNSAPDDDALLRQIVDRDSDFMRRATDEVLAYMLWVNRFAEAAGLAKDEE
jgi:CRISPR-associated protein Cmr5